MQQLSITASEIRSITTAEAGLKIPMMTDSESVAVTQQVCLDGYEFPALTLIHPLTHDVEVLVNLTNGMVFELLPVVPEISSEDSDTLRLHKIQLEEAMNK